MKRFHITMPTVCGAACAYKKRIVDASRKIKLVAEINQILQISRSSQDCKISYYVRRKTYLRVGTLGAGREATG
jgi:hypothetical protein